MTEVTSLSVLSIAHITTKFNFEIKRLRELGVWTTQFALILYFIFQFVYLYFNS